MRGRGRSRGRQLIARARARGRAMAGGGGCYGRRGSWVLHLRREVALQLPRYVRVAQLKQHLTARGAAGAPVTAGGRAAPRRCASEEATPEDSGATWEWGCEGGGGGFLVLVVAEAGDAHLLAVDPQRLRARRPRSRVIRGEQRGRGPPAFRGNGWAPACATPAATQSANSEGSWELAEGPASGGNLRERREGGGCDVHERRHSSTA